MYSLDRSKATRLKDLSFRCKGLGVCWVAMTLSSKNLQRVTIKPNVSTFADGIGETIYWEWLDLDCMLVQLFTSFSIRPQVTCERVLRGEDISHSSPRLLPEATRRGLVQ